MSIRADPANIKYASWITKLLLEILTVNVKHDSDVHFFTILEWFKRRGVHMTDLSGKTRVRKALFFLGFERPAPNVYRVRVEKLKELNSWLQ